MHATWYCDTLSKLKGSIREKRPARFGSGVLLWDDSATATQNHIATLDKMFTKYQMIQFIDFCKVGFLPESVARVAAIVGDHLCHASQH
ncbi:hypothetical protein TNCV_3119111 [Trichonephila clavipes]|uniref:Uncharacterized protein n=1 Tax=Trichonephila clavipes TaxID=2585209 RepID=A0A8X7BGF9_TRICX|nr:hypothetical protein TNCV_3119111 [Trichonephila clavipes]